jgi:hypothetical protein
MTKNVDIFVHTIDTTDKPLSIRAFGTYIMVNIRKEWT